MTGKDRILKLFYTHKTKLYLREIARLTKQYGQSVSRHLQKLEKEDILKSEKDGNLKKYSVKNYAYFTFYDLERFSQLPEIRKEAFKKYQTALPEQPVFAVLFGSTAKGSYKEHSDMDLLLITNKKISTKDAEKEADAICAIKISTFQMTFEDFKKEIKMREDPVVQSAIETGYPLINHAFYYEVLYEGV